MGRFEGLTAIVTGGAGGIGSAIAKRLVHEGCAVTATAYDEAELQTRRGDPEFSTIDLQVLDVSRPDSVTEFVSRLGRIDILVNVAGTTARGAEAFEEDSFLRVVDINLHGTMRMCRASLPKLAARGGSIVNIASMMSFFGSGTAPGYSASKGAVAQLTKSLAIAWAEKGVRVNAVAPGWILTPMTEALIKARDIELYRRVEQRTPMRRWGAPEHIADAVAFLCSADAAFITGAVLPVDGGYSAA